VKPFKVAILTSDKRDHDRNYADKNVSFGAAPEALLEGFALLPDVEVHVVSCTQQPMASPEKLADNMWFHSLHVPKLGWLRTGYQGCIRAVRIKLNEIQPDIVHGQGTERDCAISAVLSGFPNVLTIHGNMRSIAKYYKSKIASYHWLTARLESFALHRTSGVLCNSSYTEDLVRRCNQVIWRVPNPLRMPFFDTPTVSEHRRPVILNVGVITPYKRQIEILAMAKNMWKRGLGFTFHFAGSLDNTSSYGASFKRELEQAEMDGYAKYLGFLTTNQLIDAMDHSAALVHAPVEEAFGLVVAEALSRNLKLFASSTGGIVDIASNVEGAELFPVSDWTEMESAITRWIEKGSPRPTTAATTMMLNFHPLVIASRHIEIYREVLGR
jgi:glycosyltransferase involved in cell wall biosynthesis